MLEPFTNEEVKPYLQANHLELGMTLIGMTFQPRYDITMKGMTLQGKAMLKREKE